MCNVRLHAAWKTQTHIDQVCIMIVCQHAVQSSESKCHKPALIVAAGSQLVKTQLDCIEIYTLGEVYSGKLPFNNIYIYI